MPHDHASHAPLTLRARCASRASRANRVARQSVLHLRAGRRRKPGVRLEGGDELLRAGGELFTRHGQRWLGGEVERDYALVVARGRENARLGVEGIPMEWIEKVCLASYPLASL